MGQSRTVSEINGDFSLKSKKKFQPRVFIAQLRRFHLEYWMASKNYNHGATWQREKDSFAYIIAEYGERTDGQTLQTNS